MQMNVLRSISRSEVVADLCSCNELLEEYMSDDDPEWNLQCSDDAAWEAQEMSDEEFLAKAKALGLNTDMPEVDFVRKYLPDAGIVECIDRYMEYTMYRDEGQSDIVSRQYAGLL